MRRLVTFVAVAALTAGGILFWLAVSVGCKTTLTPAEAYPNAREPTQDYEALLELVVSDDGYVDYEALERQRGPLDRYVAWLARDDSFKGKKSGDHHAYWLNAYNALVLYQVLERGRPASVMAVDGWLPVDGSAFFWETQFKVGLDHLSLSEIEHERIRQAELDYRDHAAMNCASRSCPPLRRELYGKKDVRDQIADQMTIWMDDDERGVRIEGDEAVFNPIFEWFHRDFSFWSGGQGLCEIAAQYASGAKARKLLELADRDCPHRFFDYDWSLNDTP